MSGKLAVSGNQGDKSFIAVNVCVEDLVALEIHRLDSLSASVHTFSCDLRWS